MSKSKAHYSPKTGCVIAIGELPGSQHFIEIEDSSDALAAMAATKSLRVVDGQLVITDSRAEKLHEIRAQRDFLLKKSDVELMKLEDSELITGVRDAERRQALALYRQALRDITTQPDIFNVSWPELGE